MKIVDKLTIVLTLKGRNLFTLRWLWHANKINMPFEIIIADGESNSRLARLIEENTLFPNLNIKYYSYNDSTFLDFYKKISDVLLKVNTQYVMLVDNDDFLIPSGVKESILFLDKHSDYVSVGGAIVHFELVKNNVLSELIGKIKTLWYQQRIAYQAFDLSDDLPLNRVFSVYRDLPTVWYNVYRTEVLRIISKEIIDLNFDNLVNAELFHKLRTATMGKLRSDKYYLSYLRQMGTSSNPDKNKDFINIITTTEYLYNENIIRKTISRIALGHDSKERFTFERKLSDLAINQLKSQLVSLFGIQSHVKKLIMYVTPVIV